MKRIFCLLLLPVIISGNADAGINDKFLWRGQASLWTNVNTAAGNPVWLGGRYIPQVNHRAAAGSAGPWDLEFSLNINGSTDLDLTHSGNTTGRIRPYRGWIRYSADQFEVRAGLQKINFGSAVMLRPLMWFDQVDPRDPLQLTDGVWGVLGRYYFLNNMNIWMWGLLGNQDPKTWEITGTARWIPEFGGRFQVPVPAGEAALSWHHRTTEVPEAWLSGSRLQILAMANPAGSDFENVPENRFGFDIRLDIEIGLWIEAALIRKKSVSDLIASQRLAVAGTDYTVGLGNGLYVSAEQMMIDYDIAGMGALNHFTAVSLSYPLGIFDNLGIIIYRDWTGDNTFSFLNWHRQFNRLGFYLMAFNNPQTFQLPQQRTDTSLFAGRGLQFMLVFNH